MTADECRRTSLLASVQAHGKTHGYNIVVKSSSTPTDKKPGRTAKIWLRCDRGGQYRPRNGLTEETRKRKRTSRLMDCPFMLVAAGNPGFWTLTVLNPSHNHGPVIERPRPVPQHRVKKGQIPAQPYDWPHDATLTPFTTALVIIDMQKDCELQPGPAGEFFFLLLMYSCSLCSWRVFGVPRLRHIPFTRNRSQTARPITYFSHCRIPGLPHSRG
jgi:hypothetical protein